ncbi:MAG TPA: ABC-type transport auxiliary lipoprotein family protein [Polyangiaceae bacterium]
MRALLRGCLCLLLLALQPSCALTSKADAKSARYFNPERTPNGPSQAAAQPFELRLGQVSSASHLDERISFRVSSSEVGFYDDLRWTEIPEAYLRRALERELFEERKLSRIVSGVAPILDVELTSFEELREKPPKARVTLTFSLRDERRSLLERSLELEQPLVERAGSDPAQRLAQALAATLAQAVQMVGAEVTARLGEAAKAEPPPTAAP